MLESQRAIIDAQSAEAVFGGQRRLKFFSKKLDFFSIRAGRRTDFAHVREIGGADSEKSDA